MDFYTNVIQRGNSLLVRGIEHGQRVRRKVDYKPTLFNRVHKPTGYNTLDGHSVLPHHFDSIREAKDWVEQRSNQEIVFGNTQYPYCYIGDEYPDSVPWDKDQILIVTIDIEVECENGFPNPKDAEEPLLSITMKNHQNKQIIVWGLHEFQNYRDDVDYRMCKNEDDLFIKFLETWQMIYPDVITGWNTEFFDIPYLCNRIRKLFGDDFVNKLSPWNSVFDREVYQMGRKHQIYTIQGVAALDYFDLYRKFTYTNQERYTLDHIAFVELGERKDGNPFDTFREWYTKDWQSFIEYNINDVELVDKLEDKMRLIELCLTMAYDGKVNFVDVLGTVRYWDTVIYNHLRKKNIVIPQKREQEKTEQFEGAYVKDPQVGIHKWVMSFDLNSLYPHLIMQYNISPETLVNDGGKPEQGMVDKILDGVLRSSNEHCMTPNGAFFRKDIKGFLPELMENMYNDRVKYKKLMLEVKQEFENTGDKSLLKKISRYENIQMAKKISLNSAYGAIGNNWFRYFDLMVATAITSSGQLSIRWIEKAINIYLNKILKTDKIDYVVASVHAMTKWRGRDESQNTEELLKCIDHPATTVLGHPTGRILQGREGYEIDLHTVLEHMSEANKDGKLKAVELNASPYRLDLDWRLCKRAKELGVPVVINPDAHSIQGLGDIDYGVMVARKGWLESGDVLNSMTGNELFRRIKGD